MPRFAANLSMLFTDLPWPERPAAAARAGFTAVEIQFPYESIAADTLAATCTEAGVRLCLINVPAGDLMQGGPGLAAVPGREAAFAQAVDACLAYLAALGAQAPGRVNVLAGRLAEGVSRAQALATLQANLHAALPRFAAAGVRVGLEAINRHDMPGFLLNTPADLAEVWQALGRHPLLDGQIDLYHMAREGQDLPALLAQPPLPIGHLQFADCPGRGAPGSGALDWPRLFALIDQHYPDTYCAAEYRMEPHAQLDVRAGWPLR